jgi:hypothetical protein
MFAVVLIMGMEHEVIIAEIANEWSGEQGVGVVFAMLSGAWQEHGENRDKSGVARSHVINVTASLIVRRLLV